MRLPWLTSSRALPLALICLAIQAALYLALVLPDYDEPRILKFITISIALSGLWLLILGLYTRIDTGRHLRVAIIVGVVCGLAFRIALLAGAGEQIHLSDDVYRYVWDGKVTAHGINPLGISPDQLYYSELPDEHIYPKVNHPTLPSIYPPMSQFFFVVAYLFDTDGILGFKIVSLLMELLALVVFWRLAREYGAPRWTPLVYWLAPLALLEFSLSAHQDVLYLPFLGLALLFARRQLPGWTAVALCAAVLTKFIVGLAAPALFLSFAGRDRRKFIIAFLCCAVVLYLPYWFILHPPELVGSLLTYLSRWQYNGSLYTALEHGLSLLTDDSAAIARGVSGAALLTAVLLISWKVRDRVRAAGLALLAYACLTSTLFPWYLAVFFPFLVVRRALAPLALMSVVALSYWGMIGYLEHGLWYDNWWLRTLEYAPFYALLIAGRGRDLFTEYNPSPQAPALTP